MKKKLLEVNKTGTLAHRFGGAQAPAGRREFLSTISFFFWCWLVLHYHGYIFSIQHFPFSFESHMYSFFPPCSCSTIAKELKLNSNLQLLIKLWKEKMPIDQKHKQNRCFFFVTPKSQCKHCHTWKGQTKPHLGKVWYFLPTMFYKKNCQKSFWVWPK